jgi:protein SCO1
MGRLASAWPIAGLTAGLLAAGLALAAAPSAALAHKHMGAELAPAVLSGEAAQRSIYLLESRWRNDRGALEPIGALRGRPVVVAMVYTSCENACPVIVEDMKRIQAALAPAEREGVTFALFSFDPARDTPKAMAAYRVQRGLDGQWRLFTGDPDAVQELAAVLGMRYQPDGYGGFSHSSLITVLDADGVIRHQQVGIRQDPAGALAVLHALLHG